VLLISLKARPVSGAGPLRSGFRLGSAFRQDSVLRLVGTPASCQGILRLM
jgi:hypothetical protein